MGESVKESQVWDTSVVVQPVGLVLLLSYKFFLPFCQKGVKERLRMKIRYRIYGFAKLQVCRLFGQFSTGSKVGRATTTHIYELPLSQYMLSFDPVLI